MKRYQLSQNIAAVVIAAILEVTCVANEPSIPTATPAESAPVVSQPAASLAPRRHALIVCGLSGDPPHRQLFSGTVEKLYAGLTTHHGCPPDLVTVLWSDGQTDKDGPAVTSSRGPATREALAEAAANLQQSLAPQDTLWVFVLGHAHYDGRYSWLNLPGPDLHHVEFGKLFAEVRCREQVFFMTTAASGFFLKQLAMPGRIVVSATEPDREVNETLFPHKLAAALAEPPPFRELDLDRDGRPTLLDAYLWSVRETAQEYATGMLLATEHALLDDNGDGRGTEVQADFLPEDLGGRLRAGRDVPLIRSGDGALARRVFLAYPPAPPAPELTSE